MNARSLPIRWMGLPFWAGVLMLVGILAGAVRGEEAAPSLAAEVVERTGTVEISRSPDGWTSAEPNAALPPGSRLRTGADSRATVRLSDLSLVRIRERTLVEFQKPQSAKARRQLMLRAGSAFFLNRSGPSEIEFETPLANGAIRGTEFLLTVNEADGSTVLALFDGAVDLDVAGEHLQLARGQQVEVKPGQPPRVSPALPARTLIQWVFYYPAILNPDDLAWAAGDVERYADSLKAYRAGNLLRAQATLPAFGTESAGGRVYRAGLQLVMGSVAGAERLLSGLPDDVPGRGALFQMMDTVAGRTNLPNAQPLSPVQASDELARSYRDQVRFDLTAARDDARRATELAPSLGIAWARLAELEFALGRVDASRTALERARELSPELPTLFSLEGYMALASDDPKAARVAFDRAIMLDGALGPAWLGRGLARAGLFEFEEARRDIQVAAVLEPQRGVFRSYLGKAFSQTRADALADKDFRLAKELDPADPTAWYYSALHDQQLNRNNSAIRDLEQAVALNDNRAVFRSRWLLDQDLAMRNADLAVLYAAAGLEEVGERAAVRAVGDDYANYSAHLFLSRSYAAESDPMQFNLRFETPRESEWLLSNLLAPPGGGNLSRWVSQQTRLAYFAPPRFGLSAFTGVDSGGDLEQDVSFYGREAGFSYAVDGQYRTFGGQQPNGNLEEGLISSQMQQRLSDDDSVYLSIFARRTESGDVASYYNPEDSNRDLRVQEKQVPHLFTGYHHEWSPESHTLVLLGYLRDEFQMTQSNPGMYFVQQQNGEIVSIRSDPFVRLDLNSTYDLVSGEVQQIWSTPHHQVVGGVRVQGGQVDNSSQLTRSLTGLLSDESVSVSFGRATGYGYYQWSPLEWLRLNTGLSFDYVQYPQNAELPPLSSGESYETQWSPKVALTLFPWSGAQIRGAYSQSLGGLYFDNSVRLEPVQMAGFTQAFRSLIPESVVGLVPGTSFETAGVGFDQALRSGTYFGVQAVRMTSDGQRDVGALTNETPIPLPDGLMTLEQTLKFEERTVGFYVNQILGQSWTLGVRGSWSEATLDTQYPAIPTGTPGIDQLNSEQTARLGLLEFSLLYQHPRGWFVQWYTDYFHQENPGYIPSLPGDSFWQQNVFIGYRFPRQRAEIRAGVMNLTDQDYRLNPLNWLNEPRRDRTFILTFQLNL